MNPDQAVFIVDDDPAVRDALSVVFSLEGYDVETFDNGDAFLSALPNLPQACVLLDVHMPGRSGMEILRALGPDTYTAPIFIISGQGDIPMAVAAVKAGAFDFIEKPFDAETVVARVRDGIDTVKRRIEADQMGATEHPDLQLLTPREREVLEQITAGASNKEAGRTLGISPRTIEVHRARIMEKLGAKNAADLVRIVLSGSERGADAR
ncbi:MAG: response regulator transcription factor [Devosiaceae bacterium]|nr:response regulator transcription factor [Devosiaceae bacterium MH13]